MDNTVEFQEILAERLRKTEEILGVKAREYASGGNRYHNFDVAARLLGVSPEVALWGMMAKHVVSIMDMVEGDASVAMIDEKVGDAINYLILLEGLLRRRESKRIGGKHD